MYFLETIFNIKKIETPRLSVRPSITFSLLVKWEVVSPVVDRDSWNIYPLYPLIPCSDIVSQMWRWFGGGGGGGVMLFPTFLETKSGNTKQLFLI